MNISVHNLSSTTLTPTQTATLGLNLNFCPIPQPLSDEEILKSYSDYRRRLRIKKQFIHEHQNTYDAFKPPNPSFEPKLGSYFLEKYLTLVETKILEQLRLWPPKKFSPPYHVKIQKQIITELRNNRDIIIKPADKNLGVVIVDRTFYETEALRQLNDPMVYRRTHAPDMQNLYSQLQEILETHGQKNTTLADYMFQAKGTARIAAFYLIIKIHKTPITGRPICSSINTATYHASKWLDAILQPLLRYIPSFVQDSSSLLWLLTQQRFNHEVRLFTADVEALYPSIPVSEAVSALREFLDLPYIQENFHENKTFVVTLTQWVLNNNYLQFGDLVFLQIQGTAMGTPAAVCIAVIYLGMLEKKVINTLINEGFSPPLLFKRYIDDIFAIFKDNPSSIRFAELYNSQAPTIRITHHIDTSVDFLDLTIYMGEGFQQSGILDTRTFQKQLNKYLYLPPTSFHAKHIFPAFITAEIQRHRRNCSNDQEYKEILDKFYVRLRLRGYSTDYLSRLFQYNPTRQQLLDNIQHRLTRANNKKSTTDKKSPPLLFKTQWNIRWSKINLRECLRLTPELLQAERDAHLLFPGQRQPILCFKRAPNLRDLLTSSKHHFLSEHNSTLHEHS